MHSAQDLIAILDLSAHPEGGWFRETWRATAAADGRATSTAIIFLLQAEERSHWHAVDADEIWVWQGGDPLALHVASTGDEQPTTTILGNNPEAGHSLNAVVPAAQWQAAEPLSGPHGYALVSCIVAPGFDFGGFTLAPPGWKPGA